jgi:DNA polymerase-1
VLAQLRASFPALFAWRERVVSECRAAGNTIASPVYGAKRHIGELSCEDAAERAAAERRVVNGLVQCMAAEIFVTAMINVQSAVRDLGAHVVLPLHDELLVEVARAVWQAVVDAMREHMCIQVCENQPPLEIFVRIGETWDEMI